MPVWNVSRIAIRTLDKVGIQRSGRMPQSTTTINNLALLRTQDGKMEVRHYHDVYPGSQDNPSLKVDLSPELEERLTQPTSSPGAESRSIATRQVIIFLDLQAGTASATEELNAGEKGYEKKEILEADLCSETAESARLPISGTQINAYLYAILTWLTGAKGESYPKDRWVYRTERDISIDHKYLPGPSNSGEVFDAVREIALAIRD